MSKLSSRSSRLPITRAIRSGGARDVRIVANNSATSRIQHQQDRALRGYHGTLS
ncbi:hypothetical protein K466DRAFT_582653 [Polyporus arcularius HHB13444]|uniref:Uncharacterized protein n=1 Tax=Polyporus arcularius HHB13444 TaxID=1314778 RepID=A0A5C3PTA4_9APHY|nr:hypothetical protein K466DRAFT_582653 [Polyporus arcularius HHB13444]